MSDNFDGFAEHVERIERRLEITRTLQTGG